MSVHIKLIQREGFTRRIVFHSRPTWHALAAKIQSLYAIPPGNVSVVYIDAESDEVTLSTQEELDDFYESSYQHGQVIKFIVQDLSSTRTQTKALPQTPGINIRDTFGGEGFDIEDDWQRLPPFSSLGTLFAPRDSGADSPHAFVELVESDAGTIPSQHEPNMDSESDTTVQSIAGDPFLVPSTKGKERVVADDASSTRSVIAEHTPTKPAVHVFDHNSSDKDDIVSSSFRLDLASSLQSVHSPPNAVSIESTPKVAAQDLDDLETNVVNDTRSVPNSPGDVADPPLPSFESPPAPNNPSLCSDVASFFTMLTNVMSAHPELAESIGNIVHNTANGTYLNAHRDAISQAAEQLAQTAEEIRRRADEEAGRRAADALGGMLQTLSQTLGTGSFQAAPAPPPEGDSARPPAEQQEQPATANSTSFWYGASQPNARPFHNSHGSPAHHPPQPPFYNPWMRGRPPFGPPRGGWRPWMPPRPPVPPPGKPPHHSDFAHEHGPPPHPPAPPPPPPPQFPGVWEPEVSMPLGSTPVNDSSRAKPTPEESKAKVDAARLRYKAEKERYRQEREDRKKDRERKARTIGREINQNVQTPTATDPQHSMPAGPSNSTPAAIVSNGRGDYPTIELVSVHRHNSHIGHGLSGRRNMFEHNDVKSRTLNRISRRLADMGFTDNVYPDLPGKIKEQMPPSGVVSKDAEDDIVTTLLEELLAMSPKPPAPSGSNAKDARIPGAWH